MMTIRSLVLVCVACSLLLSTVGCGEGVSAVTGTVKFSDGTPLTRGMVVFHSETANPNGQIQQDGSYTLYTGEEKGVPPGSYRVSIIAIGEVAEETPAEPANAEGEYDYGGGESLVDTKYNSPETSGLTAEVKAGSNKIDFTVEKPGGAGGAPPEPAAEPAAAEATP